jgi:outer membrane autotransporter protein
MQTYPTPHPIDLAVDLQVGALEVVATDREDTVVTVAPTNPDKESDRRGAEATRVELVGDRLTVVSPKPRFSLVGPSESVDVRVELPTGSRLTAEVALGAVRSSGRLGATRVKASSGRAQLGTTGDLWLRAGHGSANVEAADGAVEIIADHGQVTVGRLGGDALLKASHGNVTVGEASGDVEVKLSYGDLEIGRALGSVSARTAYGSIALHEVSSGSVEAESGFGEIVVGVREGVGAWLDLSSKSGRVRNALETDQAPGASDRSVAVRVRTQFGDIDVRRAS